MIYLQRRYQMDMNTNEYYAPNGKFNKLSADSDIQIPNCTTYAFLRMQEASCQSERQNYWIRSSGGFGDAKSWYNTTTLPKGSTPKLGAVACYGGTYGHVAIVENIIDATHIDLSESNYSPNKSLRDWHFFNYRRNVESIVGKSKLPGTGVLLGFIYTPITLPIVERDINKSQVYIDSANHNVREYAGTSAPLVLSGSYPMQGTYDVLGTAEADGYKWVKLDDECWVAVTGDMVLYDPKPNDYIERLEKVEAELFNIIKDMKGD